MSSPAALYKYGEKVVIAAPAHSGLPTGATAVICSCRFDGAQGVHLYDITISGGGKFGSDVNFVNNVREAWLRSEGRIATAKACTPMTFGALCRLAPRLLVPLFQRRYCWAQPHWHQLWRDVVALTNAVCLDGVGQHAIGRVVIAREGGSIVLVDGQQRATTMLLLLCAVRDVAEEIGGPAASALSSEIDRVLRTRSSKLKRATSDSSAATTSAVDSAGSSATASAVDQASIGLDALADASSVKLVPSREDRLPFCSLMLRAPFDADASHGSRKMSACHAHFQRETRMLLARAGCSFFLPPAEDGGVVPRATDDGAPALAEEPARVRAIELLRKVVESALKKISLVVFELQDGVALQNMYDMLAQRERLLHGWFANVGGQVLSETDLVRNLLLNSVADEAERTQAYEELWVPMERAHGDGDTALLQAFLTAFLGAADETSGGANSSIEEEDSADSPGAVDSAGVDQSTLAKRHVADPTVADPTRLGLLEGFAELLRARGGNSGSANLYAAGTAAADGSGLVAPEAATRAAMSLLREMSAAAVAPPSVS